MCIVSTITDFWKHDHNAIIHIKIVCENGTFHVSDNHGNNLMLLGASRGKLTIIQGALEHCNITDVHDKNDFGETALHLAAKHFYTSKLVCAGESMGFFLTGPRI